MTEIQEKFVKIPGQSVESLRLTILWLSQFIPYMTQQFVARRGLQTAASLAYTSLLSIVPLIGVMFSFFGNLSVFREISETLQEFIFGNFVPAFGQTVQDYLIKFSIKASKLTATGIILLIVIALFMMSTIESALNHIWNVMSRRNAASRFLIYWAILTLGPVLVGVGLYSTSYLLALPLISTVDSSLMIKARLLAFMPFFTTSLAFTLLYILVPNCYVSRRFAVIGGVTAALLFELAKYTFGIYVKSVPTYEIIYGAIAVIPMFLIWIYLSWLIVLLGAQIAYCLSVFRLETPDKKTRHNWNFLDAFSVIAVLWESQKKGHYLSSIQLSKKGVDIPHLLINEILDIFRKANWVYRTPGGKWILSRDINEITLHDMYQLLPCKIPSFIESSDNKWHQNLASVIESHNNDINKTLGVTLGKLLRNSADELL